MRARSDYDEFVATATGGEQQPYEYQRQLARDGLPEVLEAPTGSGKTQIALAWLYRRRFHPDPAVNRATPHWLIFCLPMRVLVEQVGENIAEWVNRLGLQDDVGVHVLLGGDGRRDAPWRYEPQKDTILVGTLDMLLSRALNRGYGDGRFVWPVDFGLLNNGTHWVFDEVQLMGPALPTSRQLQAFRDDGQPNFGTASMTSSTWMSATVDHRALSTVDRRDLGSVVTIGDDDRKGALAKRLQAPKRVQKVNVDPKRPADLAALLVEHHRPGSRTLAICNVVDRAVDLYKAVRATKPEADLVLLHSRFRPEDRAHALAKACVSELPAAGTIVISTQVVEAGVDVSAAVLYTEAAPWSSIVQRAGRCNRAGDLTVEDNPLLLWSPPLRPEPYDDGEMTQAIDMLEALEGTVVTPESMSAMPIKAAPAFHPVLRRRDLLDLFDTLPDLTGNDVDVSRFIRDADEIDVFVAWRDEQGRPSPGTRLPGRGERCPVPLGQLKKWLPDGRAWRLDHLSNEWVRCRPDDLRPGMVVIVQAEAGGYDAETGWSPSSHRPVEPVASPVEDRDEVAADNAVADDPASVGQPRWYPLARHLADVEREVGLILDHLAPEGLADGHKDAACLAGRLHDIGKVHDAFQGMLLSCADGDEEEQRAAADAGRPLAKSAGHKRGRYEDQWLRKAFRHELASALALLEGCHPDLDHTAEPDLVVYLVAAHHGRVRLGFRPLPDEATREKDGRRVALGVVDGDDMPADTIPGFGLKAVSLSLGPMGIGGGGLRRSWADLAFSLRDRPDLGPFRLGFLEAVVRMADWRASRAIDEPAKEAAHARP